MFEGVDEQVTAAEIFASPEPTRQQMAAFCNTLGMLIGNGVPILEVIVVTGESTTHPWLVAVLQKAYTGLREGVTLTDSITRCLKGLMRERVMQVSQYAHESEEQDKTTLDQWAVPNLVGFFSDFIKFVDAGEESGALHLALLRVRDINLKDGIVDANQSLWGRDVSLFCSVFELLHSVGIPPLKCLKIIGRTSALRDDISVAINQMDKGKSLAKSLQSTEGQLAHNALVSIIKVAEQSHQLQEAFHRMQTGVYS